MDGVVSGSADYVVALRKESVDRNAHAMPSQEVFRVALRKESVDRNQVLHEPWDRVVIVALRKESVDRNLDNGIALIPHERRSPQGERG